jgi:hypothetical protein
VIPNVFIHLINDLPIVADVEALPSGGDISIRCTNVRTVDGKRPPFVHDRSSMFVFPLAVIRLIEVPSDGSAATEMATRSESEAAAVAPPVIDEEPDEDLLARIRDV